MKSVAEVLNLSEEIVVLLPFPLSPMSLQHGSVERLSLGARSIDVFVPPRVRVGQKIRLRNAADRIDPRLKNQDVHLLVQSHGSSIYQVKRDIHLEMPVDFSRLTRGRVERVTIGAKRFDVTVPSNVTAGQRIRLRGAAELCNGGYEGDVHLRLVSHTRRAQRFTGFFRDFRLSEGKVGIKFGIPLLFELSGELAFKAADAEVRIGR